MESGALLSLQFNPDGDLLAATRDCEAEVFLRVYGNTRQQLEEEYGPYEQASVFIALADDSGDVLGACRLIRPTEVGLKSWTTQPGRPGPSTWPGRPGRPGST